MKNTKVNSAARRLSAIALAAIIGFTMAGCKGKSGGIPAAAAPSGTYSYTALESWTITFGQGTFSMVVPAQFAPGGSNTTVSGNFTVQGNTVTLTGLAQPMTFTITNTATLTEGDGSVWRAIVPASAVSGEKAAITVANDSDFAVNAAVYSTANISGGQIGDFLEIKPIYNGQSGSFSLNADSYGIIIARDAQTVWMYPQGGSGPGLTPMSGEVNLRFTGREIVRQ